MRQLLNRRIGGPWMLALILAIMISPIVVYGLGDTQGTSGSGYNQGWSAGGVGAVGNPVQGGGVGADGKVYAIQVDSANTTTVTMKDGTSQEKVAPTMIEGTTSGAVGAVICDQNGFVYEADPKNSWYVAANTGDTAATQPSASKTAGASGVQHVCTGVSMQLFGDSTGNADHVLVNLRDGATGAGTIMAQWDLNLAAGANAVGDRIVLGGLHFAGTAATAMTLEASASDATHSILTVSMTGYDLKP